MDWKTYRAYCLVDDRVIDYAQFAAADDGDSVRKAEEILAASDSAAAVEVWQGTRKVAVRGRHETTV
jgi:hypothetical protein